MLDRQTDKQASKQTNKQTKALFFVPRNVFTTIGRY